MRNDRPGFSSRPYTNGPRTDLNKREVGIRPSMPVRSDNLRSGMRDYDRPNLQRPVENSRPLGRRPDFNSNEKPAFRGDGLRSGFGPRDGVYPSRGGMRGGLMSRPAGFRGGRGITTQIRA
jgi:hypothetical protein